MNALTEIESYVIRAEGLATGADTTAGEIHRLLNGGPISMTRSVLLSRRKQLGAFFTPAALADTLLQPYAEHVCDGGKLVDPACGAGDLLLAGARLSKNGIHPAQLLGVDIVPEFVRLARARLSLASATSGWTDSIRIGDGLDALTRLTEDTAVIMNPPFSLAQWPADSALGNGRATMAAIFLTHVVASLRPGGRFSAILPDVIRTGTRYRKLREFVAKNLSSITLDVIGAFDEYADVDVFVLHGTKVGTLGTEATWPRLGVTSRRTLEQEFDVRVGSVVPHRDAELRDVRSRYLHVSSATPWATVQTSNLPVRGFKTTFHRPPFVAVRRTSSPRDRWRAVATIVRGNELVSVENHIIVLKPKDRRLASCDRLVGVLKTESTNLWFNDVIRCRHLTVAALRQLPLP